MLPNDSENASHKTGFWLWYLVIGYWRDGAIDLIPYYCENENEALSGVK